MLPTDIFCSATHQVLVNALTVIVDKERSKKLPAGKLLDLTKVLGIASVKDLSPWYVGDTQANPVAGHVLNNFEKRLDALNTYPQLSIRALEQGQFDIVFHATTYVKGRWQCPHCTAVFKGQAAFLRKHFVLDKCRILQALEAEIAKANKRTNAMAS